ncbi:CCA tRNA nucleotidyltransferase [Candidatus Berkelbacteria bacterium]|nr:CCA tRNA nucleotidyltransferase [Candidatus Berkelbacteria bacterium]
MTVRDRATEIVRTLQSAGYETYWVGGSVRDLLLGGQPNDYDIVTSAPPEDVQRLFPDHFLAGKAFGVVTATFPEGLFEIATFRREANYTDRRRPDTVAWADAKADVLRRDFTVNGLLYDPLTETVIDHVDGQRDLRLRLIRFIGDPEQRVLEDPLRLLRAIRLKCQLDFQYDKPTYEALRRQAPEIRHVAAERVRDELARMWAGPRRASALHDLDQVGLLQAILPEVDNLKGTPQPYEFHREGDVFEHTSQAVAALPSDAPSFLVWATLLHDVAKPATLTYPSGSQGRISSRSHSDTSAVMAGAILRRLRAPKAEIETVAWLIGHHMRLADIEHMRPARQEAYVLDPRFPWLLELLRADATGTTPTDLSLYAHDLKLYERLKANHERQVRERPPLLLNGHDLQTELGLEPGPKIGELLEQVRDAQLHGQVKTKTEALKFVRGLL